MIAETLPPVFPLDLTAPDAPRLPRRVLVIRNPVAGTMRRSHFNAVIDALVVRECQVTIEETRAAGDAVRLAGLATTKDFDVVVAAGGDGTINEVINGLGRMAPPLAILPLGTANVLALEIGMPRRARKIAQVIAEGVVRPVYPGIVNGQRFLLMTGVGFDAYVVGHVSSALKRKLGYFGLGKLAYVWSSTVGLLRCPYAEYRVHVDGREIAAGSVVAAKAHFYGGGFVLAPKADLRTTTIELCVAKGRGRWATMRYALGLMTGRFHKYGDVEVIPVAEARITGPASDITQIDGDVGPPLPLHFSVSPRPVRLIYPG